jgi:hypothetical protein
LNKGESKKESLLLNGRIKDVIWISIVALILFLACFLVFGKEENLESVAMAQMSEKEQKISQILHEIDGVGEVSVVVCEEEDEVKSVVVVCEGAKDIRVVMEVREAVATALNTQQKSVKIYLKKD